MNNWHYALIRSKRKTLAIQINKKWEVIVRAPLRLDSIFIEKFLREKSDWITKNQEKILRKPHKNYSEEDILDMKKNLKIYLDKKVAEIWNKNNFLPKFTSVKVTKSEWRWGSCSGRNSLNFSYRLAEYIDKNPRFIDAVIVHELAHLKEKNHGPSFWNLVFFMMDDYKKVVKEKDID